MNEDDFKTLKKEFSDKWLYLKKNIAYPLEYFNSFEDYNEPVDNLETEDFFGKLKNKCPDDDEIQRTKEMIKRFVIKNDEEVTKLYLKKDVFF